MKRTALALIDGEHYPPVVKEALRQAATEYDFRAAVFLGGTEKIRAAEMASAAAQEYGLPVLFGEDWRKTLVSALEQFAPEVVVDLSDEPVLGYEKRFRLISETLARNVQYVGPDFHFSPPPHDRLCSSPSLAVIGTGKRVGKTAISAYVAQTIEEAAGTAGQPGDRAPAVVVVAMGRGGPAPPEVVDGRVASLGAAELLRISRQGRHAASDHFEDASLAKVVAVGCRRCGGGLAGSPFFSNFAEGVRLANSLRPGFLILEGSGAALPPVASDVRMLVVGANQTTAEVEGYLGAYRVLVSDAVILSMAEEPLASAAKVRAMRETVRKIKPGLPVVPVVYRPRPRADVEGRRVAFFSTAPAPQMEKLTAYLAERWGCRVELASSRLADRQALREALSDPAMDRVEMVLTEIKAAAIDVVVEEAERRGLPVVFVANVPMEAEGTEPGALAELTAKLVGLARERFE